MELYRHGDILVARVEEVPEGARRLHHLVLAEGELTGHSHRIAERGQATLYESQRTMFVSVTADYATLVHQEHGPIRLRTGTYRVWRQREYAPGAIRNVQD
ncbi:MAG: hypothetical protein ACKV0T_11475 [Planctomycetales bacterium]